MKTDIQKIFDDIRDIPYRIPLSFEEEDKCCSGKSRLLYEALKEKDYTVRYRVCMFIWDDLNLPSELKNISHDKDCTHTYIEILLNKRWVILDPTWDKGLSKRFKINHWDGNADTSIAVSPIKIFSPKKSAEIMNNQTKEIIEDDLLRNKKFYNRFNYWLKSLRENDLIVHI